MCRNIRPLFNFEPPATEQEIESAAIQFVRKVSGYQKPSKINEPAFEKAIQEIQTTVTDLLNSLETNSPPKNREVEKQKAQERSKKRFAKA